MSSNYTALQFHNQYVAIRTILVSVPPLAPRIPIIASSTTALMIPVANPPTLATTPQTHRLPTRRTILRRRRRVRRPPTSKKLIAPLPPSRLADADTTPSHPTARQNSLAPLPPPAPTPRANAPGSLRGRRLLARLVARTAALLRRLCVASGRARSRRSNLSFRLPSVAPRGRRRFRRSTRCSGKGCCGRLGGGRGRARVLLGLPGRCPWLACWLVGGWMDGGGRLCWGLWEGALAALLCWEGGFLCWRDKSV
ncbi:hypothetical protein EJ03DRAFT_59049 [Teratosphaeria nubilosa]|uniref:Uncharacterized protein n=1 Tax=Teratosphaeria nubilosa TaxID=161662 RepID=A0A6G1KSV4_9PEZI|nr:hypothetical protein EJ03DRAFT_59049 [Teratosphaeria nubilosa]